MILVTGAAGLLGNDLVERLRASGQFVIASDRAPRAVGSLTADLLDPDACRRACEGVRVIVHAAALQHHSAPPRWGRKRFFAANVIATENLLRAATDAGVEHFVYVSSDMVYGLPHGRPLRETDATRPIGPYGHSKLACERLCHAAQCERFSVTILRPRLIVGPGRLGVLTRLFDRIRAGRTVPLLGNGLNRYQMVAVADVSAACIAAIQRRAVGTFNLGSCDPPAVRALLAELIRRAGSASRLVALPALPSHAALWLLHALRLAPLVPEQFRIASADYVLDSSAAQRVLGWTPALRDVDMLWAAYQSYCGVPSQAASALADPTRILASARAPRAHVIADGAASRADREWTRRRTDSSTSR